jgi:hypothetical protein
VTAPLTRRSVLAGLGLVLAGAFADADPAEAAAPRRRLIPAGFRGGLLAGLATRQTKVR